MVFKSNLLNANSISRLGLKLQYMSNFKLTREIPFFRTIRINFNITTTHEAQYTQKLSGTVYFSKQHKLKST